LDGQLLTRLADEDLRYPVGPLVFSSLVASHLGNWITPADGFDAMHAGVMREIPVDEANGRAMDHHVADADFVPGDIRNQQVVPLGQDIDSFNKGVDSTGHGITVAVNQTPKGRVEIVMPGDCPKGYKKNPNLIAVFAGAPRCIPK
jgi:hypothetical protein